MGLDITLVKGTVHPNYLTGMEKGETIGSGLQFDGSDIITVTSVGCIWYATFLKPL